MTVTTGDRGRGLKIGGIIAAIIGIVIVLFLVIGFSLRRNDGGSYSVGERVRADTETKKVIEEQKRQWEQSRRGEQRARPEARPTPQPAAAEAVQKWPLEKLTPELRQSRPEFWPDAPVAGFLMEPGDSATLTLGTDGLTKEAVYISPAVNWQMWHYRANGEQSPSPHEKKSAPTRGRGHFSRFHHDDAIYGERPLRYEIVVVSLKPQYRLTDESPVIKWSAEKLTSETKNARPKKNDRGRAIEGSNEVVSWLMELGDQDHLKFSFAGDRTGWVYQPGGSSIESFPRVSEGGLAKEIAPGYGSVPGQWVRWQRTSSLVEGVTVQLVSLGKHR